MQSTTRMQQLIEDILQFSSIKDKHQGFELTSLQAQLRQVLSDMEVVIEKSGAEITWSELPQIEANPTQIRQLFQNLLSNAIKFVKPGKAPRIQIEAVLLAGTEVKQMESMQAYVLLLPASERFWKEVKYVLLHVRDEGIGFDPRYYDKVFEIFQRLHPGHEYGGTGIGLAICKRIADNHHGTITVQSAEGKGSVFSVLLPLSQQHFVATE